VVVGIRHLAPVATKVVQSAAAKTGGEIIKQAFKKGGRFLLGLGLKLGGTITAVFTPLQAGPAGNWENQFYRNPNPFPQVQPQTQPQPSPDKPVKNRKRKYEQYVLEDSEDGDFDIMERGRKEPLDEKVTLKKGDIWKYGTTVNPERRYTQKWLREKKLTKRRQSTGTKEEVLRKENKKINAYLKKYGVLPPGNKQTN